LPFGALCASTRAASCSYARIWACLVLCAFPLKVAVRGNSSDREKGTVAAGRLAQRGGTPPASPLPPPAQHSTSAAQAQHKRKQSTSTSTAQAQRYSACKACKACHNEASPPKAQKRSPKHREPKEKSAPEPTIKAGVGLIRLGIRAPPGIEPGTSCTRSKNHTTRPRSR
jgi:hypothetical protein